MLCFRGIFCPMPKTTKKTDGKLPTDQEIKHTTLDLPASFMEALDRAAGRRGITRQSLIKMRLYEQLNKENER
jgi:hypothetical protein